MDKQRKPKGADVSRPPAQFEFVVDHGDGSQTQVRQHVAKLNWRRRREQKTVDKRVGFATPRPIAKYSGISTVQQQSVQKSRQQPSSRKLREQHEENHEDDATLPLNSENALQLENTHEPAYDDVYMDLRHTLVLMSPTRKWKLLTAPTPPKEQIPPYHPLDCMDLDPFNTIMPLSRSDQRLLHHCKTPFTASILQLLISQGSTNTPTGPSVDQRTLNSTH